MRSPGVFAGALVLLLGVPLAFFAASVFHEGAPVVIHAALGMSFLLIACSIFDFKLPQWISVPACVAIGVLATVFLMQCVSDLLHSDELRRLAYGVLGQRLEKILGYVFLLWCLAVLCLASAGMTRVLGAIVLAIVVCVEIYSFAISRGGAQAPEWLKLLYLPIFLWLLLEGVKPRSSMAR
jgi:hypothetical protein